MSDYSSKTLCFVDNGLFVSFAETLAKDFGRVLYWSPWVSAYPRSNPTLIGTGLPGVIRIPSFWNMLDEIDIFVFPDIYFGPEQQHLVSLGKRVWGGRMGDWMELEREKAKDHFDSLGIDIGPFKVVTGLDALRAHLKKHKNQHVKISTTRGDMETFKAKNYALVEPRLDELAHSLGPRQHSMEFLCEDDINPAVETGYDGYCIDGKFPKASMWGIEIKDKGYVMGTKPYSQLPEPVRRVNDLLAESLAEEEYRGFISTEIRATKDGGAYFIDACQRAGSPPSELYQVLVTNWADIIWGGSEGELVEPKFAAKWGAELLLRSEWALNNWQAISFPKDLERNIRIHHWAIIDGKHYAVPLGDGSSNIGAVVAIGDTMDAAIKRCKEAAEKVEGFYVESDADALDEAKEQIEKLAEIGFKP